MTQVRFVVTIDTSSVAMVTSLVATGMPRRPPVAASLVAMVTVPVVTAVASATTAVLKGPAVMVVAGPVRVVAVGTPSVGMTSLSIQ